MAIREDCLWAARATLSVLQLPVSGSRLCLYEDGTEVTDDYFPGLPNDAQLLLLTAGQTWQGFVSDITRFLGVFNEPQAGVIRATAWQLLSDERAPRGRSCWLTFCIMSTRTSLLRPGSRTRPGLKVRGLG